MKKSFQTLIILGILFVIGLGVAALNGAFAPQNVERTFYGLDLDSAYVQWDADSGQRVYWEFKKGSVCSRQTENGEKTNFPYSVAGAADITIYAEENLYWTYDDYESCFWYSYDKDGQTYKTKIQKETSAGGNALFYQYRVDNGTASVEIPQPPTDPLADIRLAIESGDLEGAYLQLAQMENKSSEAEELLSHFAFVPLTAKEEGAADIDAHNYQYSYSYDSNGYLIRLVFSQFGEDHVYTYSYDSKGNLLTEKTPYGDITHYSYTYDAEGRLAEETSTSSSGYTSVTTYVYDANGNLIAKKGPGSLSYTYTYDARGNRLSLTENWSDMGLVSEYTYTYDGDRLVKEEHGSGGFGDPYIKNYMYDAYGALIKEEYRFSWGDLNSFTEYAYDKMGVLVTETETGYSALDGKSYVRSTTDYTYRLYYYPNGVPAHIRDIALPCTMPAQQSADPLADIRLAIENRDYEAAYVRLCELKGKNEEAEELLSHFAFVPLAIVERGDPNANSYEVIRTFQYDLNGYLTRKTDTHPSWEVTTAYEYDKSGKNGNATAKITLYSTGGEDKTTYTYDDQGNVLIEDTDGAGKTYYTYSDSGQMLSRKSDSYEMSYSYDSRGDMIEQREVFLGETSKISYRYIYDAADKLIRMESTGGGNADPFATTFEYDEYGRLICQTQWIVPNEYGSIITYLYDELGVRTMMKIQNISAGAEYRSSTTEYTYRMFYYPNNIPAQIQDVAIPFEAVTGRPSLDAAEQDEDMSHLLHGSWYCVSYDGGGSLSIHWDDFTKDGIYDSGGCEWVQTMSDDGYDMKAYNKYWIVCGGGGTRYTYTYDGQTLTCYLQEGGSFPVPESEINSMHTETIKVVGDVLLSFFDHGVSVSRRGEMDWESTNSQ